MPRTVATRAYGAHTHTTLDYDTTVDSDVDVDVRVGGNVTKIVSWLSSHGFFTHARRFGTHTPS